MSDPFPEFHDGVDPQSHTSEADISILRVPPELLDQIFGYLRGEMKAIKNVSLVCRFWHSLSLRHLFSRVVVLLDRNSTTEEHELTSLFNFIDRDPSVASHIHNLHVITAFSSNRRKEPELSLSVLETGLRKLTQLRVLELDVPHFVLDRTEGHADMQSVDRPWLKQLILDGTARPEYLPHILGLFHEIDELELRPRWRILKRGAPPKANSPEPIRISSLSVMGCESTTAVHSLDALPVDPTALQSLQIFALDSPDVPMLNGFLTTRANHLKVFRYTDLDEPHPNEPENNVDLSLCTELDFIHLTITLPVFYPSHSNHWNRCIATVKSAPHSLKQVFIDIDVVDEYEHDIVAAKPEDLLSTLGGLDWVEMGRAAAHARLLRARVTTNQSPLKKPDLENVQNMIHNKATADMRRIIQIV